MALMKELEAVLNFVDAKRWEANERASDFNDLSTYCMFVGYPRSGHSLVGSLLDAHPNMVVAHELNALRCLDAGFDRLTLFHLLVEQSEAFTAVEHAWNGYSYAVPNQWQGRTERLRVIGDKKGGGSSQLLAEKPELLDRLIDTVRLPIRTIHVIRNPYDNIATMSRLHEVPLEAAVEGYFAMARAVEDVRRRLGADAMFDLKHEDLIAEPRSHLAALVRFLGEEPAAGYLDDCASIVFERPKQTRTTVAWPEPLLRELGARIADSPSLCDYAF